MWSPDALDLVGRLTLHEHHGSGWRQVAAAENVVTNGFYSDLFNVANATPGAASLVIAILAVGTGSLPSGVGRGDTAMAVEWKRYTVASSVIFTGDPPSGTYSFFLPATDGAVNITEVGLFHGGATVTAGSGRMTTHAALSYAKSASTDLRLDYMLQRSTGL